MSRLYLYSIRRSGCHSRTCRLISFRSSLIPLKPRYSKHSKAMFPHSPLRFGAFSSLGATALVAAGFAAASGGRGVGTTSFLGREARANPGGKANKSARLTRQGVLRLAARRSEARQFKSSQNKATAMVLEFTVSLL